MKKRIFLLIVLAYIVINILSYIFLEPRPAFIFQIISCIILFILLSIDK